MGYVATGVFVAALAAVAAFVPGPPPPAPTPPGPPPACAKWGLYQGTIPKDVVKRAYQLLSLPNGTVTIEYWDARWWRFVREVHPPDKGIPFAHPGTTVTVCLSS